MSGKRLTVLVIVLVLLGTGVFIATRARSPVTDAPLVVEPEPVRPQRSVIGHSVERRAIEVQTFGTGDQHIVFVGGIHGGYEWNSALLAYMLIDHLTENPSFVPENVTVSIVPSVNPDGLFKVIQKEGVFTRTDAPTEDDETGLGRFNANNVDLNRNFDCKWQTESMWRGKTVSAGAAPFSEPEARALRDFLLAEHPRAVVFFHSKANAVYASECEDGVLPETRTLMRAYADASGYLAVDSFDAYEVTGDAEGWLASIGIPAITVELKTHLDVEWERNLRGIEALIQYYK